MFISISSAIVLHCPEDSALLGQDTSNLYSYNILVCNWLLHFTINVLTINVLLQIEVLENKLKAKINELEEITLRKLEVEEKLEEVEKLSLKEKEALNLKLKTLEKNLVVVTEVKEQLEVKLEQVSFKVHLY